MIAVINSNETRAPIAHKASHEDGGSDEIDVTGLTGLPAPVDYDADLMIGSANSAWIPCVMMIDSDGTSTTQPVWYFWNLQGITNWKTSMSGAFFFFMCSLPTNRGGKKLYVKGMRVHLKDADGNDTLDEMNTMANNGDIVLDTDTIGWDTTGLKTTTYTPVDCSTYYNIAAVMRISTTSQYDFEFSTIELDCYYDT